MAVNAADDLVLVHFANKPYQYTPESSPGLDYEIQLRAAMDALVRGLVWLHDDTDLENFMLGGAS